MLLKSLSISCSLNSRLTKFRNGLLRSLHPALTPTNNMHGESQYPFPRVSASVCAQALNVLYGADLRHTDTHVGPGRGSVLLRTDVLVPAFFYIHTQTLSVWVVGRVPKWHFHHSAGLPLYLKGWAQSSPSQ